ncbi:MAG: long-chain-fatty-acid--CoA ligase [Dehalococcoidia bacterium]
MTVVSGYAFPVKFLHRARSLYGSKVGIVDGDRRMTYNEYGDRVDRLSHALVAAGIRPGDRVAFAGPNGHPLLEAYYGVVQMGAILLPLNIRLTPADLEFILNDAEATAIIVERAMYGLIGPIRDRVPSLKTVILVGEGERGDDLDYEQILAAAPAGSFSIPPMDEDDTAEIFYTSGTTGKAKGVMLTHRNLYANAFNFLTGMGLSDSDTMLHTIPLFHVNGWGTPHALTALGGRHICVRQFVPAQVLELLQREQVTMTALVPTMVNMLINMPGLEQYDLSSLRRIIVGGAPSPWQFVVQARQKLGCDYVVGYGMTESAPILTVSVLKETLSDRSDEEQARYMAKTGLPVLGCEVRVVDGEGRDVPRDGETPGEIIARGDNVMKGYWRRPEETAATIRDGWLHTGDVATVDAEGYISIVDRAKDIIISGGENISSVEIEDALYEHPAVLEVAVIAAPDPQWGEVPVAVITLKPETSVTEEEIIRFSRERMAHFKAPKKVEIVESLPRGGTGKILKNQVREKYWEGYEQRVH